MLSILIPIYNVDVRPLVKELHQQALSLELPFEIIMIDDASKLEFKSHNRQITETDYTKYKELDKNIGRSAIRNLLAKKANFDNLLFLDSDSMIEHNPTFIQSYLQYIGNYSILSGGRVYPDHNQKTKSTILHYKYGNQREAVSISKRVAEPVRYFHSNNFMVKKELALSYPFAKMKVGYGYEDIVFASALQKAGVTISHIDNTVEHKGETETTVFLHNVKTSNTNLLDFHKEGKILETPFLKTFNILRKTRTVNFVSFVLNKLHPALVKNLHSRNPSLLFLDLYRLGDLLNQYAEHNS